MINPIEGGAIQPQSPVSLAYFGRPVAASTVDSISAEVRFITNTAYDSRAIPGISYADPVEFEKIFGYSICENPEEASDQVADLLYGLKESHPEEFHESDQIVRLEYNMLLSKEKNLVHA